MKLDLNKDFEKAYPQTYWKGMSMEELVTIGLFLPVVLGVAGFLWYYQKIPLQIGVYLGIFAGLPVAFLGLFKYQGMSVWQLYKEWSYCQKTGKLCGEHGTDGIWKEQMPFSMKTAAAKKNERQGRKGGKQHGSL